jgi:hypothetical protein
MIIPATGRTDKNMEMKLAPMSQLAAAISNKKDS